MKNEIPFCFLLNRFMLVFFY